MTKWYEKPFRKNSLVHKGLIDFCRMFKVKVQFKFYPSWCAGFSWVEGDDFTGNITIFTDDHYGDGRYSIQDIVCTVAHEVAHVIIFREGKYPLYTRKYSDIDRIPTKQLPGIIRTAFRAECYVEKRAKELVKTYFPGIPFCAGYHVGNKEQQKWLQDNYLKDFREAFARRKRK